MTRIVAGMRFGKLVTVELSPQRSNDGHRRWVCRCDCGEVSTWQTNNLRVKSTHSCGCETKASIAAARTIHGGHGSREYHSWRSIIERCTNPNSKDYPRYGGRGIAICDRWRASFNDFYADMGVRPPKMTIDRWPDVNGNYEPGNCRWATATEQARNRRRSVFVERDGERVHLAVIAQSMGITYGAAYQRLKRDKL